jgi:hypothetical protein
MEARNMDLKRVTLLAIIGLCYTFVVRTAGTFFPGLFGNLTAAQANGVLLLLASLSAVLFFAYFLKYYVHEEQKELMKGVVMAIVGSSLMSLLLLKGLLPILDDFTFHNLAGSHIIEPIVAWVSALLVLFFFIIFHREMIHRGPVNLRIAAFWAVLGSSVGLLLRTLTLFIYTGSVEARWFSDFPIFMQVVFLPVFAFSFLTLFYFFFSFYREQSV